MESVAIHVTADDGISEDSMAIRRAVEQVFKMTAYDKPSALTITLTSAERVHELNFQYAGIDSTTDVLSFPAEDEAFEVDPGDPPYLGDVIIAHPVATQQAKDAGLPLIVELQTLAIHGTLHLLGFDHDTPERQAEMWAFQSAALDASRSSR